MNTTFAILLDLDFPQKTETTDDMVTENVISEGKGLSRTKYRVLFNTHGIAMVTTGKQSPMEGCWHVCAVIFSRSPTNSPLVWFTNLQLCS